MGTKAANGAGDSDDQRNRKCLNGLGAAVRVVVPDEKEFGVERYMRADGANETVQALMRSAPHGLGAVLEAEVVIGARWVRTGGKVRGKPVIAKITKCGASLKFESKRDYLIDLSADQIRLLGLTHWQLEAALYHELKHIGVTVDSDSNVTLGLAGHDAEVFGDEIAIYGAWMADQASVREVFRQAPLFGDVLETFDRQRKALEAIDAKATAD